MKRDEKTSDEIRAWIDEEGRIRCLSQMCLEDGGCPRLNLCEVVKVQIERMRGREDDQD